MKIASDLISYVKFVVLIFCGKSKEMLGQDNSYTIAETELNLL